MTERKVLPIDSHLPAILDALERTSTLILQAAPGTGKTTRVPPALLGAAFLKSSQEILVLEPRRLAAKMSARRVADEMNENVGETVGYQFRFENRTGPKTRLRFITEGMLMRRLIQDPHLKGVSTVILDEFHERHLHSDVALSFLRHLQKSARPDLKLIVMSATLDTAALASYLDPAAEIKIDNRLFEVKISYLSHVPTQHLDKMVRSAVLDILPKTRGDILVFLPGMGEIRRAAQALAASPEDANARGWLICPLHGDLSREEQDQAVLPLPPGSRLRKIILSTNVAETSLTIEGVETVIDSGLHRVASHSWWSGVPALRTRPISKASAIQRTGRAGRLGPGQCLRLYTQGDYEGRASFETPEIQRADLAQTVLELKALGAADLSNFTWFESPQIASLQAACDLLYRLGATSSASVDASLTPLGKRMAQLPAHPRIARFLIEAEKRSVLENGASLAAYLMEGRIEALDALEFFHQGKMEESIRRVRTHLLSGFTKNPTKHVDSRDQSLRKSLLAGFPDRIARLKNPESVSTPTPFSELLLSIGGAAQVENTASLRGHSTFVILDLQERQGLGQARAKLQVQSLVAIEEEWLLDIEPSGIQEVKKPIWDPQRKRVMVSDQLTYDQLVLSESRAELRDTDEQTQLEASRILLKEAFGVDPLRASGLNIQDWGNALRPVIPPEELESFFARISLISVYLPQLQAPSFRKQPELISDWLQTLFQGKCTLAEVQGCDWETEMLAHKSELSLAKLNEVAPTQLTLPSGRRIRIHYSLSTDPWVESRLQDFFGMKKSPSVVQGRVPLTVHLLAPNGRALQVTTDLEGFWKRAYLELRPALSRRYPRHSWPENA